MTIKTPKKQLYIIEADQWHEDGYFFENNLVYSYFTDRKDPQHGVSAGRSIEDFLADPGVENGAKTWLNELLNNS